MAELYLIRHGQASFGKDDYDALSELGAQQAQVLGQCLAASIKPTQLMCGSLNRQQQTMDNLLAGFERASGKALTLPIKVHPDFNEFDHENVLEVFNPDFKDRAYMTKHIMAQKNPEKAFHRLYRQAVLQWLETDKPELTERFDEFYQRVNRGVHNIVQNAQRKECIVVVSSAGAISMCLQHVLGISAVKAFELNEMMVNTAITRFVFNEAGELNLSYFNNYQHLSLGDTKVTYR
ncbi:MAG: broad specificity phosphatase PhoE [Oceanicoccus sp.]